jgi:hypothetical protein
MISDPKTTPRTRTGRIAFGCAVAAVAHALQFVWFVRNPLLWALFALAPICTLFDPLHALAQKLAHSFTGALEMNTHSFNACTLVRRRLASLFFASMAVAIVAAPRPAQAFCGFFVGKADGQLFNKSSKVAIVRDGDRTVLTMSSDYHGELKDFALVVPVPAVLERDQIHVGEQRLLGRLDEYSAPRLVEYNDPDPCPKYVAHQYYAPMAPESAQDMMAMRKEAGGAAALGVKIEAQYTVGEYDIVLLSAKESGGLEAWLRQSGYKIPQRAAAALAPYIRQDMKFFVAKVNLKEQQKAGFQELRPIQIAYESRRFMLPIRLGMANADGAQDLIVFALTKNGRVESSNYQTAKVPSDVGLPEYVQSQFGPFYQAAFSRAVEAHDRRAVLTEYAWNMGSCDPCSAQPLTADELRALGVFWMDGAQAGFGGVPVTLTRLHVRYDAAHFPEDLMFQETGDQQTFQARYVMNHPWKGDVSCERGRAYVKALRDRRHEEAKTLAQLTGWDLASIRAQMGKDPEAPARQQQQWWNKLWQRQN